MALSLPKGAALLHGTGWMFTALAIGAILCLTLGMPAILWLTNFIRPPKPQEEAIHRAVAEARQEVRRRLDRLPPF